MCSINSFSKINTNLSPPRPPPLDPLSIPYPPLFVLCFTRTVRENKNGTSARSSPPSQNKRRRLSTLRRFSFCPRLLARATKQASTIILLGRYPVRFHCYCSLGYRFTLIDGYSIVTGYLWSCMLCFFDPGTSLFGVSSWPCFTELYSTVPTTHY